MQDREKGGMFLVFDAVCDHVRGSKFEVFQPET